MNVPPLKETSVTPTLCVTTLKDPMSAAVSVDIRVMVKTVQVNIYLKRFIDVVHGIIKLICLLFTKSCLVYIGCLPFGIFSFSETRHCQAVSTLAVRVQALAGVTALSCWASRLTLEVPFSTPSVQIGTSVN